MRGVVVEDVGTWESHARTPGFDNRGGGRGQEKHRMINKPDGVSEITNGTTEPDTGNIPRFGVLGGGTIAATSMVPHIAYTPGLEFGNHLGGHGRKSSCLTRRCGPDRNLKGELAGVGKEVCCTAWDRVNVRGMPPHRPHYMMAT